MMTLYFLDIQKQKAVLYNSIQHLPFLFFFYQKSFEGKNMLLLSYYDIIAIILKKVLKKYINVKYEQSHEFIIMMMMTMKLLINKKKSSKYHFTNIVFKVRSPLNNESHVFSTVFLLEIKNMLINSNILLFSFSLFSFNIWD